MIDLAGSVVIVTGAGRGIGREHALELARAGATVVVNDLGGAVDGTGGDAGPAQRVVDEISAAGGEAPGDDDEDPLAQPLHLFEDVAAEEDDAALVGHPAEELHHVEPLARVHAVEGLVQDEEPGFVQHRHAEAELLTHPAGQPARQPVTRTTEPGGV